MLKRILFITLVVTGFVSSAEGQTYLGISAYAAMSERFPCQRLLRATYKAQRPAISILWRSFGESTACIDWFLNLNQHRPHLLQIHITNEVCRRNRRCFEGEFYPRTSVQAYNRLLLQRDHRTLSDLANRVRDIVRYVDGAANHNTLVVLGTGLEDNYSFLVGDVVNQDAYLTVYNVVRSEWPGLISRNPEKEWAAPTVEEPAELNEVHDDYASEGYPNVIANEDAVSDSKEDSIKFLELYKGSFAIFLWRAGQQGAGQKRWQPPRERKYKFPIREEIEMGNLLKEYSNVR
jgi:hypothetical protein